METIAPPRPARRAPERPDELEALIEEARRRARRRRLALVAATAFALAAVGAIWAALALTAGGGPAATRTPGGLRIVQARGPVQHRLIQTWQLPQPVTVDLATGEQRPAATTSEVWFDRRSGLTRIVERVDGRIQSDCVDGCGPLTPGVGVVSASVNLDWLLGTHWPVDRRSLAREPGPHTFRGREVIWLGKVYNGFRPAPNDGDWLALDARTHEPVAYRSFLYGTAVQESLLKARLPDIPRGQFSFTVPDEQPATRVPAAPTTIAVSATSAKRLRDLGHLALGRTTLWLGRRFRGHGLRAVAIGSEAASASGGASPFVQYQYGNVTLTEFGARRPTWYEEGPRPGRIVLRTAPIYTLAPGAEVRPKVVASEQSAALTRRGLLVIATSWGDERIALGRKSVIGLAAALRPVSG